MIWVFIFYILKRRNGSDLLVAIAGIWFLIITTLPVLKALVRSLENQYPQFPESVIVIY
jgi:hypothetical protein